MRDVSLARFGRFDSGNVDKLMRADIIGLYLIEGCAGLIEDLSAIFTYKVSNGAAAKTGFL